MDVGGRRKLRLGKEKRTMKVVTVYTITITMYVVTVTVYAVTITVYTVTFEKLDEGNANSRKKAFSTIERPEKNMQYEIAIEEIGGSSTKRKHRVAFPIEEDTHLISSWLNISTDPIVGQGKEVFWLRVMENYNKFRGELCERAVNQLKSQWQKINQGMQKFKDRYKQAVPLKESGCTDNDVMLNTYAIWKEDKGTNFEQFTENCSKSTKISAFRAYSSSSNPETPVEDAEADTPSPIVHPMEAMRERKVLNAKLAALWEKELENKYYDILMKDTFTMSETQLKDHQAFCKIIRHKLGI
ncbi:hypothetical protein JHK85_000575 [Glycine max]|nr:hypothetical protein JHK85_000575 [Glycine max]KAG5087948.1 hypothetical protein JHK86_000560 [Glycine max]